MVQKTSSMGSRVIVIATVVILAALIGIMVAQRLNLLTPAVPQLNGGTVLQPPRPLPAFTLVDQHGRPFTTDRLAGHWSLLFFGFATCPDVCPTTLTTLASTRRLLEDLDTERRPEVVFVSVDPERDTPEKLATYVGFFDPSFSAVTGSPENVEKFTRALGVPVARTALPGGGYTMDHSAAVFVVNPQGALRALLSAPHEPAALAADYRRLVGR